jgi:antitoxin (DNA-binding transcriptional repressor) of toxin-antitoxin stability system
VYLHPLTLVATRGYFHRVKAVAVKELKNRLSSYLREVKEGEVVLVTDRGKVIAELRQPSTATPPGAHDQALQRLADAGLLDPGLPQDARAYRPSPLRRAVASADLLAAERGER